MRFPHNDESRGDHGTKAAMREFEEEVNPSGDAQWSAAAAFELPESERCCLAEETQGIPGTSRIKSGSESQVHP